MTDPYYLAANKTAAKLEMLSKELCTNETLNTWCEIVSKSKMNSVTEAKAQKRSNAY